MGKRGQLAPVFRFVPNDLVDPSSSGGIIGIARRFIPPLHSFVIFPRPRMMNALSTRRGIVGERVESGSISMGWELCRGKEC